MRFLAAMGVFGLALSACGAPNQPAGSASHGRYVGIGAYAAGELWSKLVVAGAVKTGSAATLADDEHIIVVVDSQTGEVRECGDYTGICVSLNPWTKAISTPQNAPVTLTKHLADIAEEQKDTSQKAH